MKNKKNRITRLDAPEGDYNNFEAMYREYYDEIYIRVYYAVDRNHWDAQDITQECFTRTLEYWETIRCKNELHDWLSRVASTLVFRHLSPLKKEIPENQKLFFDQELYIEGGCIAGSERWNNYTGEVVPDYVEVDTSNHFYRCLDRSINSLPELQKSLIRDVYYSDLETADIIERHGITKSFYWTSLNRARNSIRSLMTTAGFTGGESKRYYD